MDEAVPKVDKPVKTTPFMQFVFGSCCVIVFVLTGAVAYFLVKTANASSRQTKRRRRKKWRDE